jgi:hypothetical protein
MIAALALAAAVQTTPRASAQTAAVSKDPATTSLTAQQKKQVVAPVRTAPVVRAAPVVRTAPVRSVVRPVAPVRSVVRPVAPVRSVTHPVSPTHITAQPTKPIRNVAQPTGKTGITQGPTGKTGLTQGPTGKTGLTQGPGKLGTTGLTQGPGKLGTTGLTQGPGKLGKTGLTQGPIGKTGKFGVIGKNGKIGKVATINRDRRNIFVNNRWRTLIPLVALGTFVIGAETLYADGYVPVQENSCTGYADDGSRLRWMAVPTEDGGSEYQCVSYNAERNRTVTEIVVPDDSLAEAPPADAPETTGIGPAGEPPVTSVTPPAAPTTGCELLIYSEANFQGLQAPSEENQANLSEEG